MEKQSSGQANGSIFTYFVGLARALVYFLGFCGNKLPSLRVLYA